DAGGDRLEPALDSAEQRVVVAVLVMRLMWTALHAAVRCDRVHGESATAITLFGQVFVWRKIVPARRKRRPVGQRADRLQRATHGSAADEGVPRFRQLLFQRSGLHQLLFHSAKVRSLSDPQAYQFVVGLHEKPPAPSSEASSTVQRSSQHRPAKPAAPSSEAARSVREGSSTVRPIPPPP